VISQEHSIHDFAPPPRQQVAASVGHNVSEQPYQAVVELRSRMIVQALCEHQLEQKSKNERRGGKTKQEAKTPN